MSDEKRVSNVPDKELEKVTGGVGGNGGIGLYSMYTCVNPQCSQYLVYLQFQPQGNACPVCGQQMGGIV